MIFAKRVFAISGIAGLLVVVPLFFLFDAVGRQNPPAITHPEYYYSFTSVTLAWQLGFLVIATDPVRFRPLMPAAMVEKFLYVGSMAVLYAQGRIASSQIVFVAADFFFGVLFVMAFIKTRPR
jgi:hypothetical protein